MGEDEKLFFDYFCLETSSQRPWFHPDVVECPSSTVLLLFGVGS